MPTTDKDKGEGAINVAAGRMRPLVEMAKSAGVRVAPLLAAAGLPANFEMLPADAKVPLAAYFRLMHEISIALEDETLQLSPRQHLPGTMDFILSHLPSAGSLAETMKVVAEYYNLLHGGEYNTVRRKNDLIVFVTDDRRFPYTSKDSQYVSFSMECVQIFVHCMLATIAPKTPEAALRGVRVTRANDGAQSEHLAFWSAPVRFDSPVYALEYDAEAAQERLALEPTELLTADRVYATVEAIIRAREAEPAEREHVARLVREQLRKGAVDQGKVADLLGVSVATLRRRLSEEGVSFRELRKEELNGAAQRLLRKRRAIADVAEELGFSEFRSFNRAFKEWNGLTPKAFVERLDRRS
jgi:AraC-like DNA-binding protein